MCRGWILEIKGSTSVNICDFLFDDCCCNQFLTCFRNSQFFDLFWFIYLRKSVHCLLFTTEKMYTCFWKNGKFQKQSTSQIVAETWLSHWFNFQVLPVVDLVVPMQPGKCQRKDKPQHDSAFCRRATPHTTQRQRQDCHRVEVLKPYSCFPTTGGWINSVKKTISNFS